MRPPGPTDGIFCAKCGTGELQVKDSRPVAGGIRRRRRCPACGERVTTFERCREDETALNETAALCALLQSLPPEWRDAVQRLAASLAKTAATP